jgi:hypothetical protein
MTKTEIDQTKTFVDQKKDLIFINNSTFFDKKNKRFFDQLTTPSLPTNHQPE